MKKRILIVTLIVVLISTSFAFGAEDGFIVGLLGDRFSDFDTDHWAWNTVSQLYLQGGISGFPDGTFRPNNTITIAEFMRITIGLTVGDMPATGSHWASGFFAEAERQGVLLPGEVSPNIWNEPIARQEMALVIARTLENILNEDITANNPTAIRNQITDFDSIIDPEGQDAIVNVMSVGVVTGFPDGTFRGQATATRAEAATMLARMYNPFLRVGEARNMVQLSDFISNLDEFRILATEAAFVSAEAAERFNISQSDFRQASGYHIRVDTGLFGVNHHFAVIIDGRIVETRQGPATTYRLEQVEYMLSFPPGNAAGARLIQNPHFAGN